MRTEESDEGVKLIVRLMTGGQWVPGRSHAEVAELLNKSPRTIENWATTASRVIRHAVEQDPEEIRARLLATLARVTEMAMNRIGVSMAGKEYPNPDLKAAVSACAEQAKLLGLIVQKHEIAPTPEEAERLIAEAAKLAVAK